MRRLDDFTQQKNRQIAIRYFDFNRNIPFDIPMNCQ